MLTKDQELVSFTIALDEIATAEGVGVKGLQFMCRQAAKHLRQCRPDLSFHEHPTGSVTNGNQGDAA